jgi:hypothetical protein
MRTLFSFLPVPLLPTVVFLTVTAARGRTDPWEILPSFLLICYPWCCSLGGLAYLVLRRSRRDGFVACGLTGAFIGALYFLIPFGLGPTRFEISGSLVLFPLILAITGAFSGVLFRALRGPFARPANIAPADAP